ncbi:polysaccharide deacetylase family protein [Flavobacterium sp.]|uniref:polysaccharide deacetylase family protein n=1 Tax=Flavobacterium sp. TaxID=239 RepID=UPI002C068F38|nr:polysaccharide deacetylase family protein [Flavobacterium sp.]HSD09263.1 polysaccharide deacetylase family protein [Flavobacterium sp.]
MNEKLLSFILLCTFFLFSCEDKKPIPKPNPKHPTSGVVITFDDKSVDEWYDVDIILKHYSWKATFCVSKINTLTHSEIIQLQKLQKEGHEIAGHGYHHFKATEYVAENGIDNYINKEINPMLDLMNFYSLKVISFAYPYGFRNPKIDSALLKKFKIIRGTTYAALDPAFQYCYFEKNRLVLGIGIDTDYPNFSIPYLIKLLEFAKRKHKILILYGHKPVEKITAKYQTDIATLIFICNYVHQHKMAFYRLSDLDKLN